ncbi:MAG TPA: disulfide bond formation protein B, partial [Kiloniellaceae bacterium]
MPDPAPRDRVPHRHVPLAGLLLAAASAAALGLALLGQHGFGLQPCVLCLWQRWP